MRTSKPKDGLSADIVCYVLWLCDSEEGFVVSTTNAEQPTQIVTAEGIQNQQIEDDHRLARSLFKDEYVKQKAYTQYLTRSINDEYDCDASEGGQWGHQNFSRSDSNGASKGAE